MKIDFPEYTGLRCLMMPYIQGDPDSVPTEYEPYFDIIADTAVNPGDIGFLTIDESPTTVGAPHRGKRAKFGRALHTEAGWRPFSGVYSWGGGGWGQSPTVTLSRDVRILLASNTPGTCAVWDAEHINTSVDGDIGDQAHLYPYEGATILDAGEVSDIGILTPHESLPAPESTTRQFLRIVGAGVFGRESYFTVNPKWSFR